MSAFFNFGARLRRMNHFSARFPRQALCVGLEDVLLCLNESSWSTWMLA